jgi:Tfp pilus assembly protein PilE
MIVVGIIGILAAIAIPNYSASLYRSKQSEAYTMLGTIRIAQETHLAHRDCYVAAEITPAGAVSPTGNQWVGVQPGATGALPCSDLTPRHFERVLSVAPSSGIVYHRYSCTVQVFGVNGATNEFSCNAVSDIDGDNRFAEIVYCTDNDADGVCIAANSIDGQGGATSGFPYEAIRISPWLF